MKALIFGAGKIARGFIGQLLYRSGFDIVFAEYNASYAERLDCAGKYYVNVMGNAGESEWISGYRCFSYEHMQEIADALYEADIVFTSVIGSNLPDLGRMIAQAFSMRSYGENAHARTIVTCENWKEPAEILRRSILDSLETDELRDVFSEKFGVTEAVIMRSGVEPTREILEIDPLAVSVHNFWRLPVDANRFIGERLNILGMEYKEHFSGFLQQKVYTYNGSNATIAYLGALRGFKYLHEAANDAQITAFLKATHSELNPAICGALNVTEEDQAAFAQSAIEKYQDVHIVDFIERHARDPLRKLGPDDRMVGVARLVQSQGIVPENTVRSIAAALYYRSDNASDPSAAELYRMRREEGVDAVLHRICKIDPQEELAAIIHERIEELKRLGWIHED